MLRANGMRVLITGFGAFPGARTNPTIEIVKRLAGSRRLRRLGIIVSGRIFPVVYGDIERRLQQALEQIRPQAIIHLGLAGRRKALSIEARALNRIGQLRPDAVRRVSGSRTIAENAAHVLRSRWPLAKLRSAMGSTGAPTEISIDAGDYLCNQLLYSTLSSTDLAAGFIHVPKVGTRISGPCDTKRKLTLEAMVRAVEAAIIVICTENRHKHRS
jgi:pyroglutamyl-peptidase